MMRCNRWNTVIQCFPEQQEGCAYAVTVTDPYGNLICRGTTCRGIYRFFAQVPGQYHIVVAGTDGYRPEAAQRWVCLSPCCCQRLCFDFEKKPMETVASFTLTDRYYEGLPIEKGEIQLWQRPITSPL